MGRACASTSCPQQSPQLKALAVLGNVADGLLWLDAQRVIRWANPATERLLGWHCSELVGRSFFELIPATRQQPADDPIGELLSLGPTARGGFARVTAACKDGRSLPTDLSLSPAAEGIGEGFLVVCRDATGRRRLEAQLRQAQKMEAIGRLAGGVAHDLNNVLTVVKSFGELAQELSEPESEAHNHIGEVLKAAERAARITRQLLAFSRRQPAVPRVMSFNDVVHETEAMLRGAVGESIELELRLAADAWCVRVDPGHFEQVLLNLVVNARDAMPAGGCLLIETANVALDDSYGPTHGITFTPGDYVMLAVTDTGCGIPLELQPRIFEPFFTTKSQDKGTGLGLSTCYGIVKQAGGFLWVYSELGMGSQFKVYLPRTLDSVEQRAVPIQKPKVGGSETVLLVEDDSQVRAVVADTLMRQGYRVYCAQHGVEALRIAQAHGAEIDLVVSDVVMPKMGGPEMVEQLHRQLPGLRVLFLSGYSEHAVVQQGLLDAEFSLLEKPFTRAMLLDRVRAVLDGRLPG